MTDHCQIWNNADRLETDWGLNRISYTAVILRGRCICAYVVLQIGYERSIHMSRYCHVVGDLQSPVKARSRFEHSISSQKPVQSIYSNCIVLDHPIPIGS